MKTNTKLTLFALAMYTLAPAYGMLPGEPPSYDVDAKDPATHQTFLQEMATTNLDGPSVPFVHAE